MSDFCSRASSSAWQHHHSEGHCCSSVLKRLRGGRPHLCEVADTAGQICLQLQQGLSKEQMGLPPASQHAIMTMLGHDGMPHA